MYNFTFYFGTLAVMAFSSLAGAKPATLDRDKIPAEYKWDVTQIYADDMAWRQALVDADTRIQTLAKRAGSFANGPDAVAEAYDDLFSLTLALRKIGAYVQFQRDADTRDAVIAAKAEEVAALSARFGQATAWFSPELLNIPEATIRDWMGKKTNLARYRFAIERTYRLKSHVLDAASEELLSYFSQVNNAPHAIFQNFSTGDIRFATITLASGETLTLTPGNFNLALEKSRDQEERGRVTELFYSAYTPWLNTYAAIYNGILQYDWARARARNYPDTLTAALEGNDIPPAVVENLIATAKAGNGPLQRYIRLRQRLLGLKKSYLYDHKIPIYRSDKEWSYADSCLLVADAVKPLGREYQEKLAAFLQSGHIDVYQNVGKRSGAYNSGVYGVGPYVLLNHNDTMGAAFTLAHELGHTMHSIFSDENQPWETSRYTIFVAEVASTLNERLLLDELLARTDNPKERFFLLEHATDSVMRTFYRQVMFAAYELEAHRRVERGEPLTAAVLTEIYTEVLRSFYGDTVEYDEWKPKTWARVPHFFNSPYYVYQYATSFAASAQIYQALKTGTAEERQAALERYLTLLKSGGNDYPVAQLKKAGVDLTQKAPIQAVVDQMNALVDQLEKEAAAIEQTEEK